MQFAVCYQLMSTQQSWELIAPLISTWVSVSSIWSSSNLLVRLSKELFRSRRCTCLVTKLWKIVWKLRSNLFRRKLRTNMRETSCSRSKLRVLEAAAKKFLKLERNTSCRHKLSRREIGLRRKVRFWGVHCLTRLTRMSRNRSCCRLW